MYACNYHGLPYILCALYKAKYSREKLTTPMDVGCMAALQETLRKEVDIPVHEQLHLFVVSNLTTFLFKDLQLYNIREHF
jgi:hypothetical protein